jgi:hypothetical protein
VACSHAEKGRLPVDNIAHDAGRLRAGDDMVDFRGKSVPETDLSRRRRGKYVSDPGFSIALNFRGRIFLDVRVLRACRRTSPMMIIPTQETLSRLAMDSPERCPARRRQAADAVWKSASFPAGDIPLRAVRGGSPMGEKRSDCAQSLGTPRYY